MYAHVMVWNPEERLIVDEAEVMIRDEQPPRLGEVLFIDQVRMRVTEVRWVWQQDLDVPPDLVVDAEISLLPRSGKC